jgi:hypothetical protein
MTAPASAVWLRAEWVPPFTPDLRVFGDYPASEPPRVLQGPLRQCRVHDVTWRGDSPCWLCEAEP